MNIKKNYLINRNSALQRSADIRFTYFAEKELMTFEKIARLSKIKENFAWNKKKILDYGAGDQFLKNVLVDKGAIYNPVDHDTVDFNTQKLPFKSNFFDVIISLAVIEHIENIDNFIGEAFRVLRPGGIFYLSTPNFRFCYKSFYNDPTHVRPFTETTLYNTLKFSCFENVAVFPGARNKSDWFYKGKYKFIKCACLPFKNEKWYLPKFLTGKATSVIGICNKPLN